MTALVGSSVGWLAAPAAGSGPWSIGAVPAAAAATAAPADVSPVKIGYAHGRVYGRGTDGRIWWTSTSSPAWRPIDGLVASGPAVVDLSPTDQGTPTIMLFARGPAGDVLTTTQVGTVTSGWTSLGGRATSAPSAMTVGADNGGSVLVAVRGTDGAIWTNALFAGEWESWFSHGGRATSAPCAFWSDGPPVMAAVRGTDGRMWTNSLSPPHSNRWVSRGISISSAPSIDYNSPYGFMEAWRDARYRLAFDSIEGRIDAGGYLTSAPEVSLTGSDVLRYQVFARGGDSAVWWYSRQAGVGTWSTLGGVVT